VPLEDGLPHAHVAPPPPLQPPPRVLRLLLSKDRIHVGGR
jgi:hypothetical protein